MKRGQLYLANVVWRKQGLIGEVIPGKLPVAVSISPETGCFEASVPAYARERGRSMQLAVRSEHPCFILQQSGVRIPLAQYRNPDTGDQWWIEKGEWRSNEAFHDAPSFRHPGGSVCLDIGGEACRICLYDPSISTNEFESLLDDIKSWCWRMAIDESCYVTVGHESEVKVLSAEFLRLAEDFIRNLFGALRSPHCELRESVEKQKLERLKLNSHSIRFLAQRGEQDLVPGRATVANYDTPENRFLHGMLIAIQQILRPQITLANGSALRFSTTAKNYEDRVIELRSKTSEKINAKVLDENIRHLRASQSEGFEKLKIKNKKDQSFGEQWKDGNYKGTWVNVKLPPRISSPEIYKLLDRGLSVMLIGNLEFEEKIGKNGVEYWACYVHRIDRVECWRDYERECLALEGRRAVLEANGWERKLPPAVINERLQEATILENRAALLRVAASRTYDDSSRIQLLIEKACSAERALSAFGSKPDLRLVPTMIFLQSPSYSGALSSYRQLRNLTGVDDDGVEALLALEDVGMRDWPGIYERWCFVSLIKVLQDDFLFIFNQNDVREKMLKYCTGKKSGSFSTRALRGDNSLELTLHYQPKFENGRIPDFLLEISNTVNLKCVRCVLDAKACNFVNRPDDARPNAWRYLDDCLRDLIHKKNYNESGKNLVFIMHACRDGIARPTTTQSWANASSYGGDAVFYWETETEGRVIKPMHRHGAVMIRPCDSTHLKRLILMLIQFGLEEIVCASCGSGGEDIYVRSEATIGGNEKYLCTCKKCRFFSVNTLCATCGELIIKNQASWSYHDLHPINPWNIKCWSCGTLL